MKALIVYASLTGNTQEAADVVCEALENLGIDVRMEESYAVYGDEFLDVDLCFVGTYTYGADLPDDMVGLYEDIQSLNLSGKVFSTFGSGDPDYEQYCQSVDDFYKLFLNRGASSGSSPVKFTLSVDKEDIVALETMAKDCVTLAQSLIS